MKEKVDVLFILGSGHCGSTLLDLILDSHSRLFGTGELEVIGVDDLKDPFWTKVVQGVGNLDLTCNQKKKDTLKNREVYYTSGDTKIDNEDYIKRHELLYYNIRKESGKQYIVDSSKNPQRVQLLANSNYIRPHIIHLTRDWRGVFWSYYRKYPESFFYCLTKYPLSNLKIELLKRRLDIPHTHVSYNNFVNNPEKQIRKVLKLVGEVYQPSMLRFRDYEHHTVNGNRMKNGTSSTIKKDTSWKEGLTFTQRALLFIPATVANFIYSWK